MWTGGWFRPQHLVWLLTQSKVFDRESDWFWRWLLVSSHTVSAIPYCITINNTDGLPIRCVMIYGSGKFDFSLCSVSGPGFRTEVWRCVFSQYRIWYHFVDLLHFSHNLIKVSTMFWSFESSRFQHIQLPSNKSLCTHLYLSNNHALQPLVVPTDIHLVIWDTLFTLAR